ncbi:VSP [Giardia duodenalis]|uniref:VSP n=1 Tax=Giardia intestinalis (strain ATCC 50803 / WB clone C6) TaxID=184922 RepID=A0A644F5E7_GIAIC|nr:VSP [Giardia intestinalis]KAE8303846.1 VSP [Giardia intestinalis]
MLIGFLLVCATVLAKNSGKTACVAASNTACAAALDTAGCKTCGPDAQTCLDCKTPGENVQLDKRSCKANCPQNSSPNQNVCECDPGFSLNNGKDACEAVANVNCAAALDTAGCKTCGPDAQTCLDCKTPGENVQLDKRSCKANCPQNSSPNQNVCECDPGFSLNNGKDACEAVANVNCAAALDTAGCKTCGPDAQTCLDCKTPGENVQLDKRSCKANCPQNSSPNQNVCECDPGFSLNNGKDACEAVANVNCAAALDTAGCKTCGPDAQTCLDCKTPGENVQLDKRSCKANCPQNSSPNQNVCECDPGFSLNNGKDACEAVANVNCAAALDTAGCKTCGPDAQTCLDCKTPGENVQLDKRSCKANCPQNSSPNQNVCECDPGFSLNNGKDACEAVANVNCAAALDTAGCKTCGPDAQTCLDCKTPGENVQLDKRSCKANCPQNSSPNQNVCECDPGFSLNNGKDACEAVANVNCAAALDTAGCKTCGPDAQTCLDCKTPGENVQLDKRSCKANCPQNSSPNQNVCECDPGFSLNNGKDACEAVANVNCAAALDTAGCKTCGPDAQTCLDCKTPGENVQLDKRSCKANCPQNSSPNQNVCECDPGFSLNNGKDACEAVANVNCAAALDTAGCKTCGPDAQTCLDCKTPGENVQLDKRSCKANCPQNSSPNQNVCECDPGFSLNNGKDACEAVANVNCAAALDTAGCKTCGPDAQTCLDCKTPGENVQLDKRSCKANCPQNSSPNQNVCECDPGFSLNNGKDACEAVANVNCAAALDTAGCKTCGPDAQTCLDCKTPGENVQLDKRSCKANCPQNSSPNQNVCECDPGFSLNNGKDACEAVANVNCAAALDTAGCKTCGPDAQTCLDCKTPGENVQLDKRSCKANCPQNSSPNQNVCECDPGFSLNNGKDACEAVANVNCAAALDTAGCKTCGPDAQTCLDCKTPGENVQLDKRSCKANCPQNSSPNQNVCECDPGFSLNNGKDACEAVANVNCAAALDTAGCKTCGPDAQTCLDCKTPGENVQLDKRSCKANCPQNSSPNQNVCECDPGFSLNNGKDACEAVANVNCAAALDTAGCKTCGPDAQTCLDCKTPGENVQLDKRSCKANCPQNSSPNQNVCECDPGFSLNNGKDACEAVANVNCAAALDTAGCKTCGPDAQTCLDCKTPGENVQLDKRSCKANCPQNSSPNQNVCECDPGFSLNNGKDACEAVANVNCAAALDTAGCKTCGPDAQTCTACTEASNNVQIDKKSCKADCPSNSAANGQHVCECAVGYQPTPGQNQCEKAPNTQCNTPNCKTCDNPKTDNEICTECNDGNYLTPTKQCTQSCGAIGSYYNGDKVCEPCDPSCAGCTTKGPAKCTACPPGKMLKYTNDDPNQGGSCVDECKAEMDGCAECGAVIGGTKYCSKCKEDKWAPQNGVCANSVTRNSFCTNAAGGVCTQCAADHFLQDGGCYKLGRQPGVQICAAAGPNSLCTTCVNGQRPDTNTGACPVCPTGCDTCTGTSSRAPECQSCLLGYYFDSDKKLCVKCTENSSAIQGVSSCVSCSPPSNNQGSVVCYLINDSGSTNKSSRLSTGAIAGISVAVVVVVGGLVGFLCWWFLCRGKA